MNTRVSIRRFVPALIAGALLALVSAVSPERASSAIGLTAASVREMLMLLPPVFVLLGLLDVWIPREHIVRLMGAGSGIRGTLLAFFLGSAAAGPLYGAFPIAAVLYRKGCSLFNVVVFVGAWSATKLPPFLVEYATLGSAFALTRLAVKIPAILLIALILTRISGETELAELRNRMAEELPNT